MDTKVINITPSMAEEWITRNDHNRHVNERHVADLSREMATNSWKMNGIPIVFGHTGRLLDGQHRLLACIKANAVFISLVVFGADDDSFTTIDIGKKRSAADSLTIIHETNCVALSRCLGLIWNWENDALGSSLVPNPRQQLELLERSPEIRESIAFAINADRALPKGVVAFLHYAGSQTDKTKTEEFLKALHSGENLVRNSPALTLRNFLTNRENSNRKQLTNKNSLVSAAFHALNAHFEGRELKQVKVRRKGDPFPKLLNREQYIRRLVSSKEANIAGQSESREWQF